MGPFGGQLLRRYTQHFGEEEVVRDKVFRYWDRLSGWLWSWHRRKVNDRADLEMSGTDTDPSNNVDPREDLYCLMVSNYNPDGVLRQCWAWYLDYLDTQIKELWNNMIAHVIRDLPPTRAMASPADLSRIYEVLCNIARTIAEGTDDISLDSIVDSVRSAGLLSSTATLDHARQMVWSLTGPLTMLFDPKSAKANFSQLKLRRPQSTHLVRGPHRGSAITNFSQNISISEDPFHQILSQFGELLPDVRRNVRNRASVSLLSGSDRHLYPSYVSIDSLQKVAKLKIEWVNTLNLHLQLDERKNTLKLYRFPGYCRLLYANGEATGDKSFLCRLFNDYKASTTQGQPQERDMLTFYDFLRDMILSYRLLFGMDKRSRKTFRKEIANWELDKLHDGPITGQRIYQIDPLLWQLCTDSGQSPELKALLILLDGEEESTRYPIEDFPFLGSRLADLQAFSEAHKATDWKLLWQDRRDVKNWWLYWVAWAVLVIGGGTIVLQFWQLVFQIWSTLRPNQPL